MPFKLQFLSRTFFALIAFFGAFAPLFAQENYLETYHPTRNKAEMAIISADYAGAAQSYKAAFRSVSNPLAKDIFNAMVCNLLLEDYVTARKLLIKLAEKGISEERMGNMAIFELEKYDKFWRENKSTYSSIQTAVLQEVSEDLKQKKEMLDSLINEVNLELERKYIAFEKDTTLKKKLSSVDYQLEFKKLDIKADSIRNANMGKFVKIFEKEGFLTEENSFTMNNIKFLNKQNFKVYEFYYYKKFDEDFMENETIKIMNNLSMKEFENQFVNLNVFLDLKLLEAVKNGILNPEYAIENSSKFQKIADDVTKLDMLKLSIGEDSTCVEKKLFYDRNVFFKVREITENQKTDYQQLITDFGLETIEEKKKKNLYAKFDNQYFIFPSNVRYEVMSVSDCESAKKEIVGYTLFEKK
jgi:hypothetical protein